MYEIDRKLMELEDKQTPIHVSLIGCGQMGKDIIAQISKMKGIVCDIAVDIDTDFVLDGYGQAGYSPEDIVVAEDLKKVEEAVREGKKVVASDYRLAVAARQTQVVIDATGSPEMGARITMECIFYKKHIVMMNVECDVTIGPILRKLCEQAGIVYSLTAGDEPGSICEIYRFAKSLGFKVVAAGKGKNNPLDFYATPDTPEWAGKAKERKMAPRMLVEFVDGSKTMIEMAAVSNATGLVPDVRGMHCAKCNVDELKTVFSLKSQGGVLEKEGVVDFAIGNVAPGVFVVVTTDNQRIIDGLVQRDMGQGPNYLLYRPYHLCSIETPITAAQAVLYGESSGHPMDHLTSECITIAKRDLKKGEVLDSIGEYCYRASIDLHSVARDGNMLPVGLAKGAVMKCDAEKDTVLTYDMVKLSEKSVLVQLRRIQDQMLNA
nr:NAD(P)-dependent oxidoreductase [uncultured Schaedlerella sp.]